MGGFFVILGIFVIVVAFVSFAVGKPIVAFAAIVFCWPFILPAAGLGCYRCSYNIFLPYRGTAHSEHGDSWTHPDVEKRMWLKRLNVPQICPKCEAPILSSGTVQSTSEIS
jgi:hypothetical protein